LIENILTKLGIFANLFGSGVCILQVHYGVPFGRNPKLASSPQKQQIYRAQSAGKSMVNRQDSFDGVSVFLSLNVT